MINHDEQTLDKQLVMRMTDLENGLRDLKTKQLIGGDAINSLASPLIPVSLTIAGGASKSFTINFNATTFGYYVSEFSPSFFIDTNNDGTYLWQGGSNLTAAQLKLSLNWIYDAVDSSETINGRKTYKVQVVNLDTASHTYYFQCALNYPKISLS
jgi:hypothetical protein